MKKRSNLSPKEDYASQSLEQMNVQRKRLGSREFRDALTKANGSVVGVKTHVTEWNRWNV